MQHNAYYIKGSSLTQNAAIAAINAYYAIRRSLKKTAAIAP